MPLTVSLRKDARTKLKDAPLGESLKGARDRLALSLKGGVTGDC